MNEVANASKLLYSFHPLVNPMSHLGWALRAEGGASPTLTRHIKQFWNCSVDMKQLSLRQHADFFRTATISDGKRLIRAQKG